MKTVKLTDIEVVEIAFRMDEPDSPVQITYRIKDDAGEEVARKSKAVPRDVLPAAAKSAITSLAGRIVEKLVADEGL